MNQINFYLFDLDGTLIDTRIYAVIYLEILEMVKKRLNLSDEELEAKAKGLGLKKNKFKRWDSGDLCREFDLLDEYYTLLEKKIRVTSVLHNQVKDIFNKIKQQKRKIGIVSNSMKRTIMAYLKRYALSEQVDFIFSYDDAGCRKNQLNYWKKLIGKEHLNPEECLMIGDDLLEDVERPKKLGFQTFHLDKSSKIGSIPLN